MDSSQHVVAVIPSYLQARVTPRSARAPNLAPQKPKLNPARECLLIPILRNGQDPLVLLSKRHNSSTEPSLVYKPVSSISFNSHSVGRPLIDEILDSGRAMLLQFASALIDMSEPANQLLLTEIPSLELQVGALPSSVDSSPELDSQSTAHAVFVSWEAIEQTIRVSPLLVNDIFSFQQSRIGQSFDSLPTFHWLPVSVLISGDASNATKTFLGFTIDPRISDLVNAATGEGTSESIADKLASFPAPLTDRQILKYGSPSIILSPSNAALLNKAKEDGFMVVELTAAANSTEGSTGLLPRRRLESSAAGRLRLPKSSQTLSLEFYEQGFEQ